MNPYDNAQEYTNGQEPEYVEANRVTSPDQKKNVAVAAGGTTLLAASAIGLGMLDDSDNNSVSEEDLSDANRYDSSVTPTEPPLIVPISNTSGVSSMNDLDNLDTFDKAFAAARHLVGPGHYFTWHGNTYNTYYTEELDALSPAERQAFVASLDGAQPEVTPVPAQHHEPQAHHQAAPMLASHTEVEPAPASEHDVPEITPVSVPMAAAVGTAAAYPEITPVAAEHTELATAEHTGMGPHIDSEDEYMGHRIVGHDDVADHYDQVHDQISGHDVGLHMAE
ncbi:hypothetical protein ACAW74_23375 [Fibrella sp. WM1]|uniref:hypothetical protein n=1 Tax=Fibrella musci TaxID=3242485 RepID=UPI0035208D2F